VGSGAIAKALGNALAKNVRFDVPYATLFWRVIIYSQNDDYSRQFITNSEILAEYTNNNGGEIVLKKHTIIAAESLILPAIKIGEVSCLGSMSLFKNGLEPWLIYAGIPAKKNWERENRIFLIESQLKTES
jgi:galactoside O-acetyltransferase